MLKFYVIPSLKIFDPIYGISLIYWKTLVAGRFDNTKATLIFISLLRVTYCLNNERGRWSWLVEPVGQPIVVAEHEWSFRPFHQYRTAQRASLSSMPTLESGRYKNLISSPFAGYTHKPHIPWNFRWFFWGKTNNRKFSCYFMHGNQTESDFPC